MKLSDEDLHIVQARYAGRLKEFGYSPKTLGWDKGKQEIRFDVLTSQYDCKGKRILDIGCGFGDLIYTLDRKFENYTYFGVDIVQELIDVAIDKHRGRNARFESADFLSSSFDHEFDYAIASGTFNFKLSKGSNYDFAESAMKRALGLCKDGLAFDFLSDRVDYQYEHTFHYNPEIILKIAYSLSRNIILRNDYMPFEFSVFIFKDDSFSKDDTLFLRYKSLQSRSQD